MLPLLRLTSWALTILLLAAPAAPALEEDDRALLAASPRVDPALIAALERAEPARAVVLFADPPNVGLLWRELRRSAEARQQLRSAIADRRQRILSALPPGSFRVERSFEATSAVVLTLDAAGAIALLERPEVRRLGIDGRVSAQLAEALPLVRLDDVQQDKGLTGDGVQIAILDTGIDQTHPELANSVIAEYCYCDDASGPFGCCPNGFDEQSGAGAAVDDHGHGTRVAGVAASRGVTTPGAAPDVEIVAIKVLDNLGGGEVSDVVLGLNWILMNRPDVDVVNLSLAVTTEIYAGDCDAQGTSPPLFATPIDALRAAGVLTVAGTGNKGRDDIMNPPACIASALSVGGVWDADVGSQNKFGCVDATTAPDQVTCYSNSSGTTDLFAPSGLITTPNIGGGTVNESGTSFSVPMVVGCAAALLERFDAASLDQLEAALETSPTTVMHGGFTFPRLDCYAAFQALKGPSSLRGLSPTGAVVLATVLLGASAWRLVRRPGPQSS